MGNYKKLYFTYENKLYFMGEIGCPLLSPLISLSPLQIFHAYNFLISGQNHKVWVFIFLIDCKENFGNKIVGIAEIFNFSTLAQVVSILVDRHIMLRHH